MQKISRYAPSIFQGRFDFAFAGRRPVFSLVAEHPVERVVFRTLVVIVALLACSYVYLVGSTILNVIARKEALAETAKLATAVSELEREYFVLSEGIGPEDGARLGLSPVVKTLYVHRPGNAAQANVDPNDL